MGVYRDARGGEIVVCDGCGIAPDGSRPDPAALQKIDFNAEMWAAGIPAELSVKDYCPACNKTKGNA